MANTLFGLLDYSFTPTNTDIIIEFSNSTIQMMDALSLLIPEWGYNDIKDSNVSGYTINPVSTVSNSILSIITSIPTVSSNVPNLITITSSANTCINAISSYFQHTQRISGIDDPTADTTDLPHYDTAIGVGKTIAFITQQADSYANSATILGSFTSVLVEPELTVFLNSITDYPDNINSSISYNPISFLMESNLSESTKSGISNTINTISTFVTTRREHDENFYTNSRDILEQYNIIKRFTQMGESETMLIQNYIGSEKLLSRLNE